MVAEGAIPLVQVGSFVCRLQCIHGAEALVRAEAWASPSAVAHGLGDALAQADDPRRVRRVVHGDT